MPQINCYKIHNKIEKKMRKNSNKKSVDFFEKCTWRFRKCNVTLLKFTGLIYKDLHCILIYSRVLFKIFSIEVSTYLPTKCYFFSGHDHSTRIYFSLISYIRKRIKKSRQVTSSRKVRTNTYFMYEHIPGQVK